MTDKMKPDNALEVPHKKLRTDDSFLDSSEKKSGKNTGNERKHKIVTPSTDLNGHGFKPVHSEGVNHSAGINHPEPGRHLRFHSLDQDDFHSSSGNSSTGNVENGNLTEEDSGNISDSSSHASSGDWQPRPTGIMSWVHSQMLSGVDPREVLHHLIPSISHVPPEINQLSLWKLIVSLLSEPQKRSKLSHLNTLGDAVDLISKAKNILVLTGAGVSVSCGIPDFRSRDGVYRRLAVDFPDLPDPQAMFDIHYFMKDPRPFFKFAKEIYPGQFRPSRSHRFISMLQKTGRLLRNYTQNIDTLEQVAGISKVIQCHGSFATASCLKCHHKVDCDAIRENIFNQTVPHCPKCPPEEELAIMKPDIVFFGENLGEEFHRQMAKDKEEADLLIVIGSSLKVRPVALIPSSLPSHIPQILINREPLPHVGFDIELLGDGDTIVAEICRRIGSEFLDLANETEPLLEIHNLPGETDKNAARTEHSKTEPHHSMSLRNSQTKTETSSEPTCVGPDMPDTDDKNNNKCTSGDKSDGNAELSSCNVRGVDDVDTSLNTEAEKSETLSAKDIASAESDVANRKTTISDSLKESENDTNKEANPANDTDLNMDDSNNMRDRDEDNMRNLWKSRWKQSISKRLPAGSFYYDGGSRYIFPGAEVAPEEDSDSEFSDMDSSPGSPDDDKSEKDPDEEEILGPGGLSSTRRNLRPAAFSPHFHHHNCIASFVGSPTCGTSCHSGEAEESVEKFDDECPRKGTHDVELESNAIPANLRSHVSTTKGEMGEPTAPSGVGDLPVPTEAKETIIPDELHDLIAMETLSPDPNTHPASSGSTHPSLPPDLHEILVNDPLHGESEGLLETKGDAEVPDTDQILGLPSSSLLPPLENFSDTSPDQGGRQNEINGN